MRKITLLAAAFLLMATFLTGCGQQKAASDTEKWFNATYAILTASNEADYHLTGGYSPSKVNEIMMQEMLKEWWEVTDRTTADDNINWVISEGHRKNFREEIALMESDGILELSEEDFEATLKDWGNTDEDIVYYKEMVQIYKAGGENAIDAWDYSRAFQLLGHYYIAGLYTKEEALDRSLELAQTVQKEFTDWDAFVKSYFNGYIYWSGDLGNGEDSSLAARQQIYQTLLSDKKDGPYTVDWSTALEKTW